MSPGQDPVPGQLGLVIGAGARWMVQAQGRADHGGGDVQFELGFSAHWRKRGTRLSPSRDSRGLMGDGASDEAPFAQILRLDRHTERAPGS